MLWYFRIIVQKLKARKSVAPMANFIVICGPPSKDDAHSRRTHFVIHVWAMWIIKLDETNRWSVMLTSWREHFHLWNVQILGMWRLMAATFSSDLKIWSKIIMRGLWRVSCLSFVRLCDLSLRLLYLEIVLYKLCRICIPNMNVLWPWRMLKIREKAWLENVLHCRGTEIIVVIVRIARRPLRSSPRRKQVSIWCREAGVCAYLMNPCGIRGWPYGSGKTLFVVEEDVDIAIVSDYSNASDVLQPSALNNRIVGNEFVQLDTKDSCPLPCLPL